MVTAGWGWWIAFWTAAASCAGDTAPASKVPGGPVVHSSSSETSYLVPLRPGVSFQPLLSVGDAASKNGYRMVGIPDGLGAWSKGNKLELLMNHELEPTAGAVRAHGATGAFVSRWSIDKTTGEVLRGQDLIRSVVLWNVAAGRYDAPAKGVTLARFCSGDLPDRSAFFFGGEHGESNDHRAEDREEGDDRDVSDAGYKGRIYMNGEELADGRGFAHVVESGISYELPRMGRMRFENLVARPHSGAITVVAGTDDTSPGEIVLYVGTKTASGSPVKRAGLTNGTLYGLVVDGYPTEQAGRLPSGTPVSWRDLGNVTGLSGAALQALETANGVTGFNRPEDIAWNPANLEQLFFVTTASFTTSTRLWRINFVDGRNPALGGTIDLLVDGDTTVVDGVSPRMFDNITVTHDGRWIYLQEDPGSQAHLAKIWRFDLQRNVLELVAQHDPARFDPASPGFLTQDEESSGIIDASAFLGPGKFLLDDQIHRSHPDPALVQHGQLLIMTVAP
jgi:hypothetical protein